MGELFPDKVAYAKKYESLTVLKPTDRHNYVERKCSACAVDGGRDYLRRCFKEKDCYIDLSVTKELQEI